MLIIPHSQWLKMSNFTRAQWGDFKLFTQHAFIYIHHSCRSWRASTTYTSDRKKSGSIWIDYFCYFLRLKYSSLCKIYLSYTDVNSIDGVKNFFRLKTLTRKTGSSVSSQSVRWGEWKLFNQVKIIIFLSKIP